MSFPLVTIGMTCHNAEDTIRRAVSSALAQTWPEREIVIVDDGSTDGSKTILQELEEAHPEIRVIHHEANRGFPGAVNTLLAEARGQFIAFFDDDDASAPGRLEQQYRRIVNYETMHPGATVFCYSNRHVVRAGEREPAFQRLGIGRVPPEPWGLIVADYVLGLKDDGLHCWGMFGSCTLMARTDAFRGFSGFDCRFRRGAELDFAIRAALEGAHFISVDAPLITQHLTPTGDKGGNTDLRYRLLLLEKHKSYLKDKRSYLGAWCSTHAQFYRSNRHWWWRLWYLAALVCFPWGVSRERLKRSSLLARLGLLRTRAPQS